MLPYILIAFAAFFLCTISFAIAFISGILLRKPKESTQTQSYRFFFSGARPSTAINSNISAVISFYVIFIGNFLVAYGWGTLTIVSSIFSMGLAFFILYFLIARQRMVAPECLTVLDFIQKKTRSWFAIFPLLLMAAYVMSTVGTELQAIQLLIDKLPSINSGSIQTIENEGEAFNIKLYVLIVCIVYTTVGGYLGVLRTDTFQIIFIIFAWISGFIFLQKFQTINLIFVHFNFTWPAILVSFSMMPLILGWVIGSADNWIRTIGAFDSHENNDFAKYSKKIISLSALGVGLIVILPGLLGLAMRDVATVNTYNQIGNNKACEAHFSTTDPVIAVISTLKSPLVKVPDELCTLTVPDANEQDGSSYDNYTEYSNYPFHLISNIIDYKLSSVTDNRSLLETSAFLFIIFIAIFSAAVTTIDSLIMAVCQLAYRLYMNIGEKRYARNFLENSPWIFVLLFSIIIIIYSLLPFYTPKIYLSVGVFAWSCMIFLGSLTFFISLHPIQIVGSVWVKIVTIKILISWIIWFLTIVTLHHLQISGYDLHFSIGPELVNKYFNLVIDWTLTRVSMPISATFLSLITALIILREKRDLTKNEGIIND